MTLMISRRFIKNKPRSRGGEIALEHSALSFAREYRISGRAERLAQWLKDVNRVAKHGTRSANRIMDHEPMSAVRQMLLGTGANDPSFCGL